MTRHKKQKKPEKPKKSFQQLLKEYCQKQERDYHITQDLENYKFNSISCLPCRNYKDIKGCKGIGLCIKYLNQVYYSK